MHTLARTLAGRVPRAQDESSMGPMTDFRSDINMDLSALLAASDVDAAARSCLAADAIWDMMAPLDRVEGRAAIVDRVIAPIRAALTQARRRPELVIGGQNTRDTGGRWVAEFGHILGNHVGSLWGVAPSGRLAFLRYGAFHRLEDAGQIAMSRIIFDLPDLMRQAGRDPFPECLGTEMLFPGPATHDGVCPATGDGAESLSLVERMLGDLHLYDPGTGASSGQTGSGGTWLTICCGVGLVASARITSGTGSFAIIAHLFCTPFPIAGEGQSLLPHR